MLTLTGSAAPLPALSCAAPGTCWFWPSAVRVCGPVQLATPERLSAQVKLTVTSVLFQPAGAFDVVVGAVRSILTGALFALVVLPARSLTEALAIRLAPSPVITLLAGTVAVSIPDRPAWSEAVQWIVTSPL